MLKSLKHERGIARRGKQRINAAQFPAVARLRNASFLDRNREFLCTECAIYLDEATLVRHVATFVDREVVVSDNLVTARTWHDNWAWMREYMKLLNRTR